MARRGRPTVEDADHKIFEQAKTRLRRCNAWEGISNRRSKDDLRFASGDPDNGWQWPNEYLRRRQIADRPCLTINRIQLHNNLIINDARKNKAAIKIIPVGGQATKDSADIYNGVIRHIEYQSNASAAYDTALEYQVEGGVGYWRVLTEYADEDTFDQEIFIKRIRNPFNCFLDPDAQELDYSDSRFGFIFKQYPREEFKEEFPSYMAYASEQTTIDSDGWVGRDYIQVAEYYRKVITQDTLIGYTDENGQPAMIKQSEINAELASLLKKSKGAQSRKIDVPRVEWFFFVGRKIADRADWPGKYVPLVKIVGRERIVDGVLDRKGHTRNLKDAQRMLNYMASAGVEALALQTKSPWVGAAKAIEGYEEMWFNANNRNFSFLPYNHWDAAHQKEIQAPMRPQPPVLPEGYQMAMQNASQDMMAISGQFQAMQGQDNNAQSGVAERGRQGQGETATFNFVDNLAYGIQYTGKILIDLVPKVYDTQRVIRIIDPAGEESQVTVDPDMKQAMMEMKRPLSDQAERFFNPNVGKYEVRADVGPAYATRRKEAFDAYVQVITQSPDLMKLIGDLVFKNADFPGAEEIAERLKRTIPPEILGTGPSQSEVQMQEQVKSLSQMLESAIAQAAQSKRVEEAVKYDKRADAYKAETDRMKALQGGMTPDQVIMLVSQVLQDALATDVVPPEQAQGNVADGGGPSGMLPAPGGVGGGEAQNGLQVPQLLQGMVPGGTA